MHSFKLIVLVCAIAAVFFTFPALFPEDSSQVKNPTAASSGPSAFFGYPSSSEIAFVSRVIDGDTIEVEIVDSHSGHFAPKQKVRYVGMDTPETVDPRKPVACFGHEASARNRQLVEGNYVLLEKNVRDTDKYGRLLRFIYRLDGMFVDLELVREGYARALTIPPDTEYSDQFAAAESAARAAGLGFWSVCPSYPFS